jgi:hypothetical protein
VNVYQVYALPQLFVYIQGLATEVQLNRNRPEEEGRQYHPRRHLVQG